MMVADRRKTTHVLECRDVNVEQFLLEFDAVPVNERQTAVNVWNKLTASVVEATSVNTFKKRLDEWMDVEL